MQEREKKMSWASRMMRAGDETRAGRSIAYDVIIPPSTSERATARIYIIFNRARLQPDEPNATAGRTLLTPRIDVYPLRDRARTFSLPNV